MRIKKNIGTLWFLLHFFDFQIERRKKCTANCNTKNTITSFLFVSFVKWNWIFFIFRFLPYWTVIKCKKKPKYFVIDLNLYLNLYLEVSERVSETENSYNSYTFCELFELFEINQMWTHDLVGYAATYWTEC